MKRSGAIGRSPRFPGHRRLNQAAIGDGGTILLKYYSVSPWERSAELPPTIKFREIAMQMLLAANEFASPQRAAATARRDQVGQFLARIEHARLDRGLGDADDIGDLLDRLAVVVDEVDHRAMLLRLD